MKRAAIDRTGCSFAFHQLKVSFKTMSENFVKPAGDRMEMRRYIVAQNVGRPFPRRDRFQPGLPGHALLQG
ncbi:hypothetical protein SK3146_05763 [Paenibacillus konkukensis]|uniref:Uncharacterized protein n=1 Tax=Paenibacillus konkukensis TaxID=2020716 RepID=A0ABY4RXA0_9BACL|nr:hypothetical protein SK3146_05763 [Paenibacillus konkukensis]